jgi:hypothetical protein
VPALVVLAALASARRAKRLPAAQAITAGAVPADGHALRAQRALAGTRLSRAVSLGLGLPFARPARTALTVAAVVLGVTAVTLATGLTSTVITYRPLASRVGSVQVTAAVRGNGHRLVTVPSASVRRTAGLLRAVPGTRALTGEQMIGDFSTVFTVLLAVVAALSVLNTILLTVTERRRDLGMLKSIGMPPPPGDGHDDHLRGRSRRGRLTHRGTCRHHRASRGRALDGACDRRRPPGLTARCLGRWPHRRAGGQRDRDRRRRGVRSGEGERQRDAQHAVEPHETSDAGPAWLAARPGSSTPAPTTAPRYRATPCGTVIVRRS